MTVAPKPTSRMAYPFNAKDGKAFTDVQDAYAGLALADGGHFPLGNNGHFHGGIHFDRGTANVFSTEEGVQCVADGEIVAYRIDEHYPDATPVADIPLEVDTEEVASADEGQEAPATAVLRPYSTGFVLVRHRLQAPPLPAPASDDALAPATTEPDYGTRLATRASGPTVGWLPLYARVALMELQNGWAKVRIQPPSVATWTREPVAEPWLPLYSLDRLPTTLPNRWFGGEPPVATVVLGSQPKPQPPMCKPAAVTPPPELVLYSLYMHLADGTSYQATPGRTPRWWPKKQHRAGLKTKNKWTLNDQVIEGLTVRALDSSTELGILVRGSVIEIEPMAGNDKWGLVQRIIEGGIATQPDGVQITELEVPGRVYLEELDAFSAPAAFDNIEIPVPPIPLSMGEVIGHLGQQVSSSDTLLANQPASRPMLHLEIFSAEDVPRFLLDSRRYAENLPKQHWTLVRLRQGDPIKAEPRDDAPSVIDMATDWTTGITRHTTVQQDDHQQSWVNVQVLAADGSIVHGWAKDTDRRLTPWHWPGFDVVDAASNQAGTWWDGTASAFVDFLRGGQRPEETPFFKHIRQLMGLNNQGELSEENLDAALQNRALAKRLGGLIAYHTSEWHVPSWAGKYGVISEIAVKLGKWAMDNVKAEKNCVMKLRWWGEVAADVGLPEGAKVYHFHPIGLVWNLERKKSCMPLAEVLELALRISGGYEGRSDLDYHALADDFDGQGTSFGLIQWNFGQGTLGPVLLRMYQADSNEFSSCFPSGTNYTRLRNAIVNNDRNAQLDWVRKLLQENRIGWSKLFNSIGSIKKFQEIQLQEAAKYHENVRGCIDFMRGVRPELMREINALTYVALYDLCVQQNGLKKGNTISRIEERTASEDPRDQISFLRICVEERAGTASTLWAADALSRRMGIVEGKAYAASLFGKSAERKNSNFGLLKDINNRHVCDL